MKTETKQMLARVAPFAAWMALMTLLPATAGAYAVRSLATLLALGFAFRTIRESPDSPSSAPRTFSTLLVYLVPGVLVAALWILPDCWAPYRVWCCRPIGLDYAPSGPSLYDPAVCGWPLTLAKLVGSAFVIAPAEEIFFRSFLYRRLQSRRFADVPHGRFDLSAFLWTTALFALEHDRLLAALLAGALYGLVYVRWGLGAAVSAHVVTNLLLALHVIGARAWNFW